MNNSDRYSYILEAAAKLRRQLGAVSCDQFSQLFLKNHFKLPFSSMHREIFQMLQQAGAKRGLHLAIAAPRGHAKSTIITLAYVLRCICYKHEGFIVLISDTADQANDLLGHIKSELESNPVLRASFPDVCEEPGATLGPPRWRQDEIITRNGVRIVALGAQKKVRGRRYKEMRPTLIIADDLENDEKANSAIQREKTASWWTKAVMNAGTAQTNIIVVGTLLHYESLLAKLLTSPGWTGRKFQAVISFANHQNLWEQWALIYNLEAQHDSLSGPDAARAFYIANQWAMLEGTEVLWPQLEDYYALMELRLTNGQASFDSEKQNEPIDPANCTFREADFRFWDDQFDSEEQLIASIGRENIVMVGACDPSLGKAGRNRDDSAIVTLLVDMRTGKKYVLDADIRKRSPDQIIEDVIAHHDRRNYNFFVFETVQFQEFLATELIKRSRQQGMEVPVQSVVPVSDKMGRIQSLQPLVSNGGIHFCRRHRLLMDQLRQFPKAAHDDGPDALEMAVHLEVRPQGLGLGFVYMTPIRPGSMTCVLTREPQANDDTRSLADILWERSRRFFRE